MRAAYLPKGWLNSVAPEKVLAKAVFLLVSQFEISWLKGVPRNASLCSVSGHMFQLGLNSHQQASQP